MRTVKRMLVGGRLIGPITPEAFSRELHVQFVIASDGKPYVGMLDWVVNLKPDHESPAGISSSPTDGWTLITDNLDIHFQLPNREGREGLRVIHCTFGEDGNEPCLFVT